MLTTQRKRVILEKLAETQESSPDSVNRYKHKFLRIMGTNLGFGSQKASKQTVKTVPGQEVLHSGGRWPGQALAEQEARIGVRPNVPQAPTPLMKQSGLNPVPFLLKTFGMGGKSTKAATTGQKTLTALQKKEIELGLRSSSGTPVRVTTGNTRQWARKG